MRCFCSPAIMRDGSTNERFQRSFINGIALVKIDRSRFFRIEARIEEGMRILRERALKKVHFDGVLESPDRTHQSPVRPERGSPTSIPP